MAKKTDKPKYKPDDGHTIYNMDGVGRPRWFGNRSKEDRAGLTRAERRAAIKAAFATYAPRFAIVIGCFVLVAVLLYFWLK